MKSKLSNWVLILGVLCFVVGAIALVFGSLGTPEKYALPAMGLILVGAGNASKHHHGSPR